MNTSLVGIGMTSSRTRRRLIERLRESGITNSKVLDVIENTPRHIFVDEALAHRAYEDTSLPIGHAQTISQPYIVARMTEVLLSTGPYHKVLEIGSGSGYQSAILAQLVPSLYSVERILPLLSKAKERLRRLNLRNIHWKYADGGMGWQEEAPFDGILVTAAPECVPPSLREQLAEGGRLVIPVGGNHQQELQLITRTATGFKTKTLESVRFVPLIKGALAK